MGNAIETLTQILHRFFSQYTVQRNAETLKFFLHLGITLNIIHNGKMILKSKLFYPEGKKYHQVLMASGNNLAPLSLKAKVTEMEAQCEFRKKCKAPWD